MTVVIVVSFSEEKASWAGICKILEMEVHGELTIFDLLLQGSKIGVGCRIKSLLQASGFDEDNFFETVADDVTGPARWLASVLSNKINAGNKKPNCFSLNPSFIQKIREFSGNSSYLLLSEIDDLGVDSIISWLMQQSIPFAWEEVDYRYQNYPDEKVESLEMDIADEREKMKLALQQYVIEYERRIEHLKDSRRYRICRLQAKADTEGKAMENDQLSAENDITRLAKINSLQKQVKLLNARFQSLIAQLTDLQNEVNKPEIRKK